MSSFSISARLAVQAHVPFWTRALPRLLVYTSHCACWSSLLRHRHAADTPSRFFVYYFFVSLSPKVRSEINHSQLMCQPRKFSKPTNLWLPVYTRIVRDG